MIYLFPGNPKDINYGEICPKAPVSAFFSDSIISSMKRGFAVRMQNSQTNPVIGYAAITAIACVGAAFCPKIIALGCVTVLAFVYNRSARKVGSIESRLLRTMTFQKIVNDLSAPKLNEDVFTFLKKQEAVIARSLDHWQSSLPEEYKELDKKVLRLCTTLNNLQAQVNLAEDLTPLITEFTDCISHLRSVKEKLEKRTSGFFLPLEDLKIKLVKLEDLPKKLKNLQSNKSFFKENGALFHKIQNIFQETDLNLLYKMSACRNFMFYSFTGTALLIGQSIGHPYLIMGLGVVAVIYAVKNALKLIAHRNDEAKKQDLLATITKDEETILTCSHTANNEDRLRSEIVLNPI